MRKIKTYYSSSEVMKLYDISERTFRYRMVELKKKYKGQPSLLSKQNKKWRIHHNLLKYFAPKRNNKE